MKFLMECPMKYWPDYLANLLYYRGKKNSIARAQIATWKLYVFNEVKKRGKN